MAHITTWSKMESVSPSLLRNLGRSVLVGEGSKTDIHEPGVGSLAEMLHLQMAHTSVTAAAEAPTSSLASWAPPLMCHTRHRHPHTHRFQKQLKSF